MTATAPNQALRNLLVLSLEFARTTERAFGIISVLGLVIIGVGVTGPA